MISAVSGSNPEPIARSAERPEPAAAVEEARVDVRETPRQPKSVTPPKDKEPDTGSEANGPRDTFDVEMLEKIAARILSPESRLSIDTDEDLGNFIYRFVNRDNGEVLKQYPAEAILERMKALSEYHERVKARDT